MRTERKKQQKNRGFTLVEMIVTVAIVAIFSGVVLTAVTVGSNLYRNVSSNTKVQVDTQQLLDDMENLIIDANRSVYYASGSGNAIGSAISDDIDSDASGDKTFLVCNEYENGNGTSRYIVDVLDWVESDGKIWYSQRQFTADSSDDENADSDKSADADPADDENGLAVQSADDENGLDDGSDTAAAFKNVKDGKNLVSRSVYAEGIKNFRADVSEVTSNRIVRFQLTTENHGKEINTLHTVNLRNRIQVMKPGDAFDDAKSSDVSISIIGAPESIDAGSSVLLSYKLIGDASIDPTTLKWTVTSGAGSFPDADPTYGKLTAEADGTGTITVTVSAKRADNGETITSAPVTIKINNNKPAKTVTDIKADKDTILIGAGCSVDLNSAVGWNAVYSDGSIGSDHVSVSWSLGDSSLATLGNDGQLSVNDSAGTAGNGSFTVTAVYQDADSGQSFNGNVTVNVARIDLTAPVGTYNVGDQKPAPAYVYMEGGSKVSGVQATISTTKKPEGANDYQGDGNVTDGTFAGTDVGEWEVKGSVSVADRGGYGTVESVSGFVVEAANTDGYISSAGTTVVIGNTYECTMYHEYGFKYVNQDKNNLYCEVTWSIEGNSSSSTTIKTGSLNVADIKIGPDEKGFILKAVCQYYNNNYQKKWIKTNTVEKSIDVAYKAEVSDELPDIVNVGETYPMAVDITIGSAKKKSDGTYEHTSRVQHVTGDGDGGIFYWSNEDKSPNVRQLGLNEKGTAWTVPNEVRGKKVQALAIIQNFAGNFAGTHENYLRAEKMVEVNP